MKEQIREGNSMGQDVNEIVNEFIERIIELMIGISGEWTIKEWIHDWTNEFMKEQIREGFNSMGDREGRWGNSLIFRQNLRMDRWTVRPGGGPQWAGVRWWVNDH